MSLPATMRAAVFAGPGRIVLEDRPVPSVGPTDALLQVTLTSLSTTDALIVQGSYPADPGRILGHEPVGVIAALGSEVRGFRLGQRVIAGAVTPCGQCHTCLDGNTTQCGGTAMGGWRLGHTIDGCQAEYVLVPHAQANLEPVPDQLTDEQALVCPNVMSAGFAGPERAGVRIGDTVAIFAQGALGLCATAGARLLGASRVIAVEAIHNRLGVARRLGADVVINHLDTDPVEAIMDLTGGRGADVAIDALGAERTFDQALRSLKPGGTLASIGAHPGALTLPSDGLAASLRDYHIVTALTPGGRERMRRLLSVLAGNRADLRPIVTHRFPLERIADAYDLVMNQRDGVMKVAIRPGGTGGLTRSAGGAVP